MRLPWAGFWPVAVGLLLSRAAGAADAGQPFGQHWMLPPWVQFLLATPVQFILGARFYKAGWGAIKALSGNMDLLVAIGTSGGVGLVDVAVAEAPTGTPMGTCRTCTSRASAVVVTLVLLGKWLEARAKRQTTAAIRALQALRPEVAHLLSKAGEGTCPWPRCMAGDRLVVRPGERVPADGVGD